MIRRRDLLLPTAAQMEAIDPSSYTEIEYIKNEGDAWIDLGIMLGTWQHAAKIEMVYMFEDGDEALSYNILGYYNGTLCSIAYTRGSSELSTMWTLTGLAPSSSFPAIAAGEKEYCYMDANSIICGPYDTPSQRTTIEYTGNSETVFYQTAESIALFKVKSHSGTTAPMRIYSLTIEDFVGRTHILTPILDYQGVPCLRDSYWDSNLYNSGTGYFSYA